MKRIYLDHNATSPVFPEVIEVIKKSLETNFGNPSSAHRFGQKSRAAVENSREKLAELINAKPSEIIFTGGGTESDNTAVFSSFRSSLMERPHIITTEIEHPAILETCGFLERNKCRITRIKPGTDGRISAGDVEKHLDNDTVLVSVMLANNELGTLQPVKEISELLKGTKVLFHTDAVQCGGKYPIDVCALGVDMLSLSAHKMNGPKGIGLLYVREGIKVEPYIMGGHQEKGIRAGTESVYAIEGFAKAAEIWIERAEKMRNEIGRLRDMLENNILSFVTGTTLNGCPKHRVCNTSNISFDSADGGALVISLDLKGICVSSGSACFSGSSEPSKVLSSIGCSPERAKSSIRFSLGTGLKEEDISIATEMICLAVSEIRSI